MWISALSSSSVFPKLPCYKTTTRTPPPLPSPPPSKYSGGGSSVGVVECSSRPQKKATAHHMKTRPKKSQPWDIRRKPTVYAPLPSLPPDWTLSEAAAPSLAAEEEDKGGD